ncbi:MAG: hypothetical protein ACOX8V_00885 [Thermoleophilia bacterium]|jgi:hypothetical protein
MADEIFSFEPAVVPKAQRGFRRSKYLATVEAIDQFLKENPNENAVKIELGDVSSKSAYASFRTVIAREYPDSIRLTQRGGDLYIERRRDE